MKLRPNIELLHSIARSRTAANKGLAIPGGQWLIEVLCFYSSSVPVDSFVLRNEQKKYRSNVYIKC